MKARINKNGYLEINRAGQWKAQDCPKTDANPASCGDWCPLFNEGTHNQCGKDESTVLLACSALGPWYWITEDARRKVVAHEQHV